MSNDFIVESLLENDIVSNEDKSTDLSQLSTDDESEKSPRRERRGGERGEGRGERKYSKTRNQNSYNPEEKVLHFATLEVKRIAKVTKGGRYFRVSVVAVAGDKAGNVGYGVGKAFDMSDAKKKAMNEAKKSLRNFPLYEDRTILHDVVGKCGATSVLLRKAGPGTSIIASAKLSILFGLLGIKDIVAKKTTGSSNMLNLIEAVFQALDNTSRTKFFKEFDAMNEGKRKA